MQKHGDGNKSLFPDSIIYARECIVTIVLLNYLRLSIEKHFSPFLSIYYPNMCNKTFTVEEF